MKVSEKRTCKLCSASFTAYSTLQNKCRQCTYRTAKPIKKQGKEYAKYERWKKKVAIPYLDTYYGRKCDHCKKASDSLDVAHKLTRGARHDLKYSVTNVRYLCRECHRKETDGKLK